jgi:hypothetical protein
MPAVITVWANYRARRGGGKTPKEMTNMPLEMRSICEKCETSLPEDSPKARICSFECTFCADCAEAMAGRCPNCSGELVARPRRNVKIA